MRKTTLILQFVLLFNSMTTAQTLEWVMGIGGNKSETGNAITVDNSGNVIVTGVFQDSVDFDPFGLGYDLTSMGGSDIFIQKLDANGKLLWAKAIGGNSNDSGESITVDSNNNIYITGKFEGTADVDPNAGIFNLYSDIKSSDIFTKSYIRKGIYYG
jgi:Beta-propeller repeat